jgi:FlaA1/EpsC-like NDP-sugar epimerase
MENVRQNIRILVLLCIDALIISLSVYFSYLLRFDFKEIPLFISAFIPYVILFEIFVTIFFLHYYKIYRRMWQYASVGDIISIVKAVVMSTLIYSLIHYFGIHYWFPQVIVPRSIYLLTAMIMILGIGGSRFLWRIIRDNYIKIQPYHRHALVIGAGYAGTIVVKELKHYQSEIYPIAFIDEDVRKKNLEVLGVPVVGGSKDIQRAVETFNITDIIIALPSASRTEIADILEICKQTGCQIKMIPRMNDLINGNISLKMIRDVSVEDLLGREPVSVDLNGITDYLTNHVVMVTGAGGSIGSELCRQIAEFNPEKLLLLGRGENSIYEIELELRNKFPDLAIEPIIADIQHKQRIHGIFDQYRPQVVFHAAAHKHVPLMEQNPIEAIKNNILGTKNVSECAHEFEALKFVMVSTDKAVNPTSVMGATKRIAEMIVQSLNQTSNTHFSAVRFGNVLGSRGSVIPIFKRQIESGGPITVTHPEMIRYFMTIPEAVQLVIQTGALATGGEVFILDMGKPVKIADLAHDLIRLSGLEPDKDIKVVYSGIRPGEKLFEELLTSEEGTSATKHDRIYVGRPLKAHADELSFQLKKLECLTLEKDQPDLLEIREQLKQLVPSYQVKDVSSGLSKTAGEALRASLELVASIDKLK